MTPDTIHLEIDRGSRNPNVTLSARCGYMVVHLGESTMRIHDFLAGSKCQIATEYRSTFFWQCVTDTEQVAQLLLPWRTTSRTNLIPGLLAAPAIIHGLNSFSRVRNDLSLSA